MDVLLHTDQQGLTARVRELSLENEQLRQQAQNAEAEAGWFKAQWDKDSRHRIGQMTSHVRDVVVKPHQWSRLQKESRQQKRLMAMLRAQKRELEAQVDDNHREKRQLHQSLECIRDHVSRLCRKYMESSMVAAAFSELPPEELLELLECHVEKAIQKTRTRTVQEARTVSRLHTIVKNHKQTIQDLRDNVEATKQAQQEGIQALDDANTGWHDRLHHWQTQIQELHTSLTAVPCEGLTETEATQAGSRTCPHIDRQMVSITLCSMCLCKECDQQARASTCNGSDTVECLHCSGACTVVALPKWWHQLWTKRWDQVRSQTESMCETFYEIDLT